MELKIKDGWGGTRAKLIVSAIALVFSIIAALLMTFGIFLVPFLVAAFILIFFLERGNKKIFSIVTSALSIAIDFVFNGIFSASSLTAVIVAVIIYLAMTRGFLTKGEAALTVTLIISVVIALLILFSAFYVLGSFDFGLALDYFAELTDNMRELWVKTMEEHIAVYPDTEFSKLMTPELIVSVFDSYVSMLYSVIGIFAFLIAGLAFKLVSLFLSLFLVDKRELSAWRFSLSRVFGFFYLGLYALSIFFSGTDVASIIVLNLINVFMFIFAYIGFGFAYFFLKTKTKNKLSAVLILSFACIMFYSFAINLLSFIGVFAAGLFERMNGEGKSIQG